MPELVERLRKGAQGVSDASKMLADAKSARQDDPGSRYGWLAPEQTDEWLAADRIEHLEAALRKIDRYTTGRMSPPKRCEFIQSIARQALDPLASVKEGE